MQMPSSHGLQYLWSSWSTALVSSGLGVILIYYTFKFLLTARSSKQIDFLVELTAEVCGRKASVAACSPPERPSESQSSDGDADEFDFEDDDNWETEGVEISPISGIGRRGEGYSGLNLKRKSSVVRITSSDPSSTLSTSPIQLDLENGCINKKSGLAGGAKANSIRRSTGSVNSSSSPQRKRKESGLSNHSPKASPNPNASLSDVSLEDGVRPDPAALTASRSASGASIPASTATTNSQEQSPSEGQRDSLHGITGLTKSPLQPPSILKTKPERYCGGSLHRQDDQSFYTSLYPDSRGRFSANVLGLAPPSRRTMVGGGYSSASAYVSQSETRDGNSEQLASTSVSGIKNPSLSQSRLDDSSLNSPSTNSASSISSSPEDSPPQENVPIGLGFSNQSNGMSWPHRRMKVIKLMEPDWTPYVQFHERARERMETAAQVAIVQSRGGSISLPSSPLSSPNTKRMGRVGIEDFRNSTIENLEEFPLLLRDSGRLYDLPSFTNNDSEAGDEDFWFERHVQSTAASGRDWDWRKRRARVAKAHNLALARANSLNQDSPTPASSTESGPQIEINGVGKADVQLQHQQRNPSRKPPTRTRSLPSTPLISFTPQELANAPKLARMDSSSSSDSKFSSHSNSSSNLNPNRNSLSINTNSKSLQAREAPSSPAFANIQTEGSLNGGQPQSPSAGSAPAAGEQRYPLPQLTTSDQHKLYSSNDETSRWSSSVFGQASSASSPISNGKPKSVTSSASLRKKLMGSKSKTSATSELLFSPTSLDLSSRPGEDFSPSFANLDRSPSNSSKSSANRSTTWSDPNCLSSSLETGVTSSVPAYPASNCSRRSSDPEAPSLEALSATAVSKSKDSSKTKAEPQPPRPRVRTMSLESTARNREEIESLLQEAEEYRSEEDGEGAVSPFSPSEEEPGFGYHVKPPKASKKGILAGMSEAASTISSPPRPKRAASYREGALGLNAIPDRGTSPGGSGGWSSADAYGPALPASTNAKKSINGTSSAALTRPQIKSIDTNSSSSSSSPPHQNESHKVGSIHSSDSGSQSEKRWKPGSGLPVTLDYSSLPATASEQVSSPIATLRTDARVGSLPLPRKNGASGSSNGSTSSSSLRRRGSKASSNGILGGSDLNKTASNGSISSSTGTGDPPVMRYPRHSAKSSKRSTILNSADGASQILISHGNRGKVNTRARISSLAPEPSLQPEPAPMGMVARARTASINSNQSSTPPSPRSQAFEKLTRVDSGRDMTDVNGLPNGSNSSDPTTLAALKAGHRLSSPPANPPPALPLPPLPPNN